MEPATRPLPEILEPLVSLAEFTSYKVGGPAEWFVAPRTLAELQEGVAWAQARSLPVTLLGAGSNMLVSDQGLPGLVVFTKYLRSLQFDVESGQMTAGAGRYLPRLAHQAAKLGYSGLEWAVGIPGTVGGAVVMNAGAHGGSMEDIFVSAQVLEPDGNLTELKLADLDYTYRTSILQGKSRTVVQACLQLQAGVDPEQVKQVTQTHLNHRLNTQPYHLPSCGSVFRNPGPRTAGWLIEQAGLKGFQIGQAQVAERHANFILNCGGARASDILRLIRHVQAQVSDRWGFDLKPEVKVLGDFASVIA
jgi:UDP-N-acetylmuramate dehydrogenase